MKPGALNTVRSVVQSLQRRIYAGNAAGCCLHIVIDDGNLDDDSVAHCIENAKSNNHPVCIALSHILKGFDAEHRALLLAKGP